MVHDWDAEVGISEVDAALVIAEQFPALNPVRVRGLGVGWDNVALLVNDTVVFRFPRRRLAIALIETECRALPLLAPHLPLPISTPTYVGRPGPLFPHPFAGYDLLPGVTACARAFSEEELVALAPALGRFLARLHGLPVPNAVSAWAPRDEIGRARLKSRVPRLKERLNGILSGLPAAGRHALLGLVDELAEAPPREAPPAWVHGDLYARHLLVDTRGRLTGVIDWGDVHLGDPALDLSILYSFLVPAARAAFRAAYGPIDEATERRARFRALHYGAVLVEYGVEVDDATIRGLGERALAAAVVDAAS